MNPAIVVQPPCEGGGVADCEHGFHNPPGQMCSCVPDIPPEIEPVPTLETWALIGLMVIICIVGLNWIWRRNWSA